MVASVLPAGAFISDSFQYSVSLQDPIRLAEFQSFGNTSTPDLIFVSTFRSYSLFVHEITETSNTY